jgi:hypothetical protein
MVESDFSHPIHMHLAKRGFVLFFFIMLKKEKKKKLIFLFLNNTNVIYRIHDNR